MARPNPYLIVTTMSLAIVACQPRDPMVEAPIRIDIAPVSPAVPVSLSRHWAALDGGAAAAPRSGASVRSSAGPANAVPAA